MKILMENPMIYRILLLFILVLSFSCTTNLSGGDTGSGTEVGNPKTLFGTVLDSNNIPISNAAVRLQSQRHTVVRSIDTTVFTNLEGKYVFNLPPLGSYALTIRKDNVLIGYINNIKVDENISQEITTPISKPGMIKGVIKLEETSKTSPTRIRFKNIPLSIDTVINSGSIIEYPDIPEGTYFFTFEPEDTINYSDSTKVVTVQHSQINDISLTLLRKTFTEKDLLLIAEELSQKENKHLETLINRLKNETELFEKTWLKSEEQEIRKLINDVLGSFLENYTDNELIGLVIKITAEKHKDYTETYKFIKDENILFNQKWSKSSKQEVKIIIIDAANKAKDTKGIAIFTKNELGILIKATADTMGKNHHNAYLIVEKEGKVFTTDWQQTQYSEVITLIESAVAKAEDN